MKEHNQSLPKVVSQAEWQSARDKLLVKEKAHTRAGDALAAERRRLPMVKINKDYIFEGADGKASLIDLFEGRRQLILYHFMFGPTQSEGCSWYVDHIGHLAHLHARDISLVLVSRAPQAKLKSFKQRMGWRVPWFSSFGSDFNADFGATVGEERDLVQSFFCETATASIALISLQDVFTTGRGDEHLGGTWSFLDLTPLGRQEVWEDSPEGWPQTPPNEWWRHHDRYVQSPTAWGCCQATSGIDPSAT
jgi:predicted dithiol-disulfide oxidoreductase (DUF899 family)